MKKLVISALVLSAVIAACKDDKDDTQPQKSEPTKMDLITGKTWKVTGLKAGGTDVWNFPGVIQACQKDDTYKFRSNSIMTDYDTPLKCDANDPDTVNSTWAFTDNEGKIMVDFKKFEIKDTATIIELTESKMRLSLDYQGTEAEVTFQPK